MRYTIAVQSWVQVSRKVSQARRDKRRSSVWKLTAPTLTKCTQCGEYKLPHQVCGNCGYYKGKEIVKKEA